MGKDAGFTRVDEYIHSQTPPARERLTSIRAMVREAAPEVCEAISYQIPVFKIGKEVIFFMGAWEKHIGIYPIRRGIEVEGALAEECEAYRTGKATLRFPFAKELPAELIEKLIAARLEKING